MSTPYLDAVEQVKDALRALAETRRARYGALRIVFPDASEHISFLSPGPAEPLDQDVTIIIGHPVGEG